MRGNGPTERSDRAAHPLLEPTGVTRPPQLERRWARWTAAAGCLGALGYGGLKAIWALGGTIGVDDPAKLRAAGTSDSMWLVENLGTVALAALASLILLALVLPMGAVVPRPILRTLGWLGTVMVVPGAVGLVEIVAYVTGVHGFGSVSLGGVSAGTYVFVYVCFLTLGLAFAATTFLTRRRRGDQGARLGKIRVS